MSVAIHDLVAEAQRRAAYKLATYYPETGPYRRALYPKHLQFFEAGAVHRERCFMAANRIGKTGAGAYEVALHATGAYDQYAPWWTGRRFPHPVTTWAAGDTSKTVRDIVQAALLGSVEDVQRRLFTGMLPHHLVAHVSMKQGTNDAVETIWVKHVSGALSPIYLKSYDQRREAFQGTAIHVIWLDEESPEDIYTECLLRTAETSDFAGGIILLTFTPLMGVTPLVQTFLPKSAA